MSPVIISIVFACGICSFFAVSMAGADELAEHRKRALFKDPYDGGARLSEGGGEPGEAYMAVINAIYNKDHKQICKLLADEPEMAQCLDNKKMPDSLMKLFGQPKTHRVMGGFMKGDEATLHVAYTWAQAPESFGYVVMKRANGRWVYWLSGASASTEVDARASGTVDLGSGESSGSTEVDAQPSGAAPIDLEAEEIYFESMQSVIQSLRVAAGRGNYTGKCPINITYTASIEFKLHLTKDFSLTYYWERSDGSKTRERSVTPAADKKAMSIKEVWHIGEPGRQYKAWMRFRMDYGVLSRGMVSGAQDSPVVEVVCK